VVAAAAQVTVEARSEPERGTAHDPIAQAVQQGVREVRHRNALVVAWARIALRCVTLALYLYQWRSNRSPQVGWVIPVNLIHLAVAGAVVLLLLRRWRVTAVALVAAVVDVSVVAMAGLHATGPATSIDFAGYAAGYLSGVMQLMLLFAAVSLPARLVWPLALTAVGVQVLLAVRADLPPIYWTLHGFTAAAFALVVVWTGSRMVKLAARMAVNKASAELAEAHARSLEAAHAEVAAQRDRLVAAQNEAEVLTQVIVHDLKNPLATLLQYISLAETALRDVPGTAAVSEDLERAAGEGRRLPKLIGDLLLVHRLERGVMAAAREPVPVRALLESVSRRFTQRALERGVSLELAAEDLVAPIDLELVERLLENLMSNALRHVGRGDRVRLEALRDGGMVRLAVRNSGPPVPEPLRGRLFDRYVTAGRREWHNVGLGLYLCRLVAEAHTGSIALEDRPGWNVSFEVKVPLAPDTDGARAFSVVSG
jgi:signal transduction histidine kinase